MNPFLTNWNFLRGFRLAIGLLALVQGILNNDILLIIMSVVIGGMALFNIGCCGVNGCSTSFNSTKNSIQQKDVEYEEVVNHK